MIELDIIFIMYHTFTDLAITKRFSLTEDLLFFKKNMFFCIEEMLPQEYITLSKRKFLNREFYLI